MTTLPDTIRHSELLHQLVLDQSSMEEWGRIEVLWMYVPAHRVLGFVCKSGLLGNRKLAFKLGQLQAFGSNGLITRGNPDETDADRVRQLESLIHHEVWSQAGDRLGQITDCVFNLRSGAILDYLVVPDRLSSLVGTIYRLPPQHISSLGRRRVLIADTQLDSLAIYREGLPHKLSKASHILKEDYTQATQGLRSLVQQAQVVKSQAQERLQTLTEQAKERAQQLAEQAIEAAQVINEQLQEAEEREEEIPRPQKPASQETMAEDIDDWFDFEPTQPTPTASVPRVPIQSPSPSASPPGSEPVVPRVEQPQPQPPIAPLENQPTPETDPWMTEEVLSPPEIPQSAQTSTDWDDLDDLWADRPLTEPPATPPSTPPQPSPSPAGDDDEPWL